MEPQTFVHRHRVTYSECTLGDHVYYSRYLDLLEVARGEMFRSVGQAFHDWQARGFTFPVVELNLRYHRPARYDDDLSVEVWLNRLDRLRLHFGCAVRTASSELVLDGETRHVCASLEGKPRRLPPGFLATLAPFVRPLPPG